MLGVSEGLGVVLCEGCYGLFWCVVGGGEEGADKVWVVCSED